MKQYLTYYSQGKFPSEKHPPSFISSDFGHVTPPLSCACHITVCVVDGGEVVPASVTVEGGGSGSYLDCFSVASLEPPAIAVYNPDVLGVYLVFIIYPI